MSNGTDGAEYRAQPNPLGGRHFRQGDVNGHTSSLAGSAIKEGYPRTTAVLAQGTRKHKSQ
jgi:hypothetical protein